MGPFDLDVSSVSWIDRDLMSAFSGMPNPLANDAWIDLMSYGMYHTANPTPPAVLHGQKGPGVLEKKFRSFTTFSIQLQTGADGKFESVRRSPGSDVISDPGYTPPFDSGWELWKGLVGTALTGIDATLPAKMHAEATSYNAGEQSSLSQIVVPGAAWQNKGVPQLPYSTIKVGSGETILGHSLIKFRVSTQGDYIAIVGMGAPNHLPWVWCETLLTYKDNDNLVLYGAGSAFPCHAFYVDGRQKGRLDLAKDRNGLKKIFTTGLKADINIVYGGFGEYVRPMLGGINAQVPTQEASKAGETLPSQSYTAPANEKSVRLVLPLSSLECWR
jgi:hypothetical protein